MVCSGMAADGVMNDSEVGQCGDFYCYKMFGGTMQRVPVHQKPKHKSVLHTKSIPPDGRDRIVKSEELNAEH